MSLVLPKNPNVFANSPLDRAGHLRTDPEWLKAAWADRKSAFIPVWKLMPFLIRNREGRRETGWITVECQHCHRIWQGGDTYLQDLPGGAVDGAVHLGQVPHRGG